MRIAVAGDHAGLDMKNAITGWLNEWGHQVSDLGAHTYDRDDDYPDFADAVAQAVSKGTAERGIICCGSGVGASIAANKVAGVRAAMCHDTYSAHQGVEHDDMNVLCVGGRVIGAEVAREVVQAFLGARFIDEGRYRRRLNKVLAIEARTAKAKS
ncbi:MAG: ribose 5-phosphate isomerase [Dehalococcoidia bacterium]|nr:ribose 5-phosphate isomerase [Dehalococcoidia bacterium]